MNIRSVIIIFLCLYVSLLKPNIASAQPKTVFTHADTLRGSNGAFRSSWDLIKYELTTKPDYLAKTIEGKNKISFLDKGVTTMQIDLQEPMILDSAYDDNNHYSFTREGNVYWLKIRDVLPAKKKAPMIRSITLVFHGRPREAIRPPWDGGWCWKKDQQGNPWASVACQGLGASVWYPCKDIQNDEPDSGAIQHIIVPDSLVGIGNGRLTGKRSMNDGNSMYTWVVKDPINNYCIVPSIGKYVHFGEKYAGLKGNLDMDYWVLDHDLEKAKKQFTEAPRMMKAFEYWLGPYPFYEDGYKLVQSPYLGMELQSATAYGNGFRMGYAGRDLSESGWGMKWDFIIVHESGHEWFGNSITSKDIADMWIHESFTNYCETLFTEYYFGKEAGNAYLKGIRINIDNDIPIIGKYGVNEEGSVDMYYKGGNMIHMIRQVINNDKKFRELLLGMNKDFYHKTVTTVQMEQYINTRSGIDFSKVFDQYLRTIQIPMLEYKIENKKVSYRWTNVVPGFKLPIKVSFGKADKTEQWLKPTGKWQTIKLPEWYDGKTFIPNDNFYINVQEMK